jgi:hypothetical protein
MGQTGDGLKSYPTENNGRINRQHAVELDQSFVLGFLRVAIEEELLDTFNGQLIVLEGNLICLWCIGLGESQNEVWEGGREQNYLYTIREQSCT